VQTLIVLLKRKFIYSNNNVWKNPFGDGKAGKRIIEILRHEFD
jgi:UDP-N-acetylglucosamine 2-epimerase